MNCVFNHTCKLFIYNHSKYDIGKPYEKKFIWSNLPILLLKGSLLDLYVVNPCMASSSLLITMECTILGFFLQLGDSALDSRVWPSQLRVYSKTSLLPSRLGNLHLTLKLVRVYELTLEFDNLGCIYLVAYVDDIVLTCSDHHGMS